MYKYNADVQYQALLARILNEGKQKGDRTGTGTRSLFSHTLEIDMSEGFPLITTKKMFTKGIIHELLWFLKGDTNIKYLIDNGVNIWTPDAYRKYKEGYMYSSNSASYKGGDVTAGPCDMDEFVEKIKTNDWFCAVHGGLGPVYGHQWVNWDNPVVSEPEGWFDDSINQIQEAVDKLKDNPDDRRIIVSAWNVAQIKGMTLPPCHWAFELYTEELTRQERIDALNQTMEEDIKLEDVQEWFGFTREVEMDGLLNERNIPTRRLSLKWHQRSVDTFLGLPFNIASYGLLLHMFAQQANMVVGKLVGDLTNVHIYNNHQNQCIEQLDRVRKDLPKLELNKADDIFSYRYEDFNLVGYTPHSAIKGDISV